MHARSHIPGGDGRRLVAGCMTGTSIDSLDAALVRIDGRGLGMRASVVRCLTRPLGELGPALRRLAEQHPATAGQIAALSREFSLLHAGALKELLAGDRADLVAVHGQTVFHAPPASWQLCTPAVIAHGLGVPVVSDLRAADLARGGQGAPITPIADWVLFRTASEGPTAIVNLGGFCNVTLLAGAGVEQVRGMDVCACNHVLDRIARVRLGAPYDDGGLTASRGTPHAEALHSLAAALSSQARSGRSLGTGDEVDAWLEAWAAVAPADLAATACHAIAEVIAASLGGATRILLAGGGTKNGALVRAIAARGASPVETTASFGVPPEYREAAAMAVLGALCADGVPITLPAVTGVAAPAPISGTWVYP